MRRLFITLVMPLAVAGLLALGHAHAQQQTTGNNTIAPGSLSQAQIDHIIQAFSQKETEFRRALTSYGFKRDVVIQTIGLGGQITGEYRRVSTFSFDDAGNRYEKIVFFPMPTLNELQVTQEDLENLGGIQPFALEASQIGQYKFTYVGTDHIDELDLYVFDVGPKVMPDARRTRDRYFQGRIWVDQRDLQIVKVKGKAVPEGKQRFPIFETYREQIDGRFWFPTYTVSDDQLVFDNGQVVHFRMRVRYTDFHPGSGRATITEVTDDPLPEASPSPSASPTPAPTPTQHVGVGSEHDIVSGGVLNGRATDLPKPLYPQAARKAHVSGTVRVKVLIDEQGKVTSAEVIEGPEELQQAAVDAAYKAKFSPTIIDGHSVKITGEIDYDFAAQ